MKIIELTNKIQIPITNEESNVLAKFRTDDQIVEKRDLSEREVVLANSLVVKDILYRKNDNGRITYQKKTTT